MWPLNVFYTSLAQYAQPENIHLLLKGKYHCMPEPLFDSIVFDQTSKSVVNST